MKATENQKIVIVDKEAADKDHPYSIINLQALNEAAAILKNNDFKLWVYIARHQNQYKFALSRVAFCKWSGTGTSTYHRAISSLVDKGYLVPKSENSNTYIFYEGGITYATNDDIEIEITDAKKEELNGFIF